MSYARSLRKVLEDKNPELYGKLLNIEKVARSLLTYTAGKFPYYTPHDYLHSENVEDNLNWIITDELKGKLNTHEIFFLLVAAWMHDWGMVGKPGEKSEDIRKVHHLRTEKKFEELYDKLHLSEHEARIIGRICRGHTKEDLHSKDFGDVIFGSNIQIRRRFLAAVLRIADECDITANRTPEILYYDLNPTDRADEEFSKHLSIMGVGQPKKEKHKIQLFAVARDPKGVEALERVKEKIQKELDDVKVILAQYGVLLDYVELAVETKGFINEPISFDVDQKRITELLIGEHLYSRKDVAIRELLQNSIDACRMKKSFEEACSPRITFYKDDKTLVINDTGFGMDFETAKKYLSMIGASLYTSKEFEKLKKKATFDPISRFGIGILSCFLISSQVIIETKQKGKPGCRFSIKDLNEGWRYERSSRSETGTQVILTLNDDGKKLELEESLLHYAKAVEFPIFLVTNQGTRIPFNQKWDNEMGEAEKFMTEWLSPRPGEYPILIDHLSRSTDEFDIDVYIYNRSLRSPVEPFMSLLSMFGVYVGEIPLTPGLSRNLLILMNLKKNLVDLNVSRENILHNEKSESLNQKCRNAILDFIMTRFEKKTEKAVSEFEKFVEFCRACSEFFSEFVVANKKDKEIIVSFLSEKCAYPIIDRDGLRFSLLADVFADKSSCKFYEYSLLEGTRKDSKTEFQLVTPILKKILEQEEAVIVTSTPMHIQDVSTVPHGKPFLEYACSSKALEYERNVSNLITTRLDFVKVKTPLDSLLPPMCSFVESPAECRGMIIQLKPFIFKEAKPQTDYIAPLIELFVEFIHFPEFSLDKMQVEKDVYVDFGHLKTFMISEPEYAFDKNDPRISPLIKRNEEILSNALLKELIRLYLRVLLMAGIGEEPHYSLWAWHLEDVIFQCINEEQALQRLRKREDLLPLIIRSHLTYNKFEIRTK